MSLVNSWFVSNIVDRHVEDVGVFYQQGGEMCQSNRTIFNTFIDMFGVEEDHQALEVRTIGGVFLNELRVVLAYHHYAFSTH